MKNELNYKGVNITKLFPSGYYEIYNGDRFIKFDCLASVKAYINENKLYN